jgi:nucleoside-diphosphate-sugar epimerase
MKLEKRMVGGLSGLDARQNYGLPAGCCRPPKASNLQPQLHMDRSLRFANHAIVAIQRPMHVLVTGGAGYIGSTLVPHLLENGHEVTVLDRCYFGEDSLAPSQKKFGDKLRLVRQDVRNFDAELLDAIDGVVDLAGISNDPACELEPDLTRSINLHACQRLVELAEKAKVKRFVFASSCSVYGHAQDTALVETSPLNPVSLYAECKAEAEKTLFKVGGNSSMAVTALRFATAFGVSQRMRFDLAINVMSKNAYVDRRITVEGGGRQWRPFAHVYDISRAIRMALEAPVEKVDSEVFNVGSTESNLRIMTLAYRIRDQVPGTEIVLAPTDPDLRDYNVNFDKIARVLDYKIARTIDDGIAEVVRVLREGDVDPTERRWYTLRQYMFLNEVERCYRDIAVAGRVLS